MCAVISVCTHKPREFARISALATSSEIREFAQRRRQRERKKAIGLDKQKNNFASASRFLYISLPSLHGYNVKMPNFTFCRGREQSTTTFFFLSWTLMQSFRIELQKNLPTFDELNEME